jgi:putative ABC transport system permease protein
LSDTVWRDIPAWRLAQTVLLSVVIGAIIIGARLAPMLRSGRRSAIVVARRHLEDRRTPFWLRSRVDVTLILVGAAILGGNLLIGGLKPTPVEGQTVALSFYVLLAPLALWIGTTLLIVRGLLALLARRSRPERAAPLTTWQRPSCAGGRRPRAFGALVLGALMVTFGRSGHLRRNVRPRRGPTRAPRSVPTFGSRRPARGRTCRRSARVSSPRPRFARSRDEPGSDRKNIMAIEADSYGAAAVSPQITRGGGVAALAADRSGVLIAEEVARGFQLAPGDILPVTVFPDEPGASQKLDLHVVGVYRAFPPTDPLSEIVVTTRR